jgi:hypothetical protein
MTHLIALAAPGCAPLSTINVPRGAVLIRATRSHDRFLVIQEDRKIPALILFDEHPSEPPAPDVVRCTLHDTYSEAVDEACRVAFHAVRDASNSRCEFPADEQVYKDLTLCNDRAVSRVAWYAGGDENEMDLCAAHLAFIHEHIDGSLDGVIIERECPLR